MNISIPLKFLLQYKYIFTIKADKIFIIVAKPDHRQKHVLSMHFVQKATNCIGQKCPVLLGKKFTILSSVLLKSLQFYTLQKHVSGKVSGYEADGMKNPLHSSTKL